MRAAKVLLKDGLQLLRGQSFFLGVYQHLHVEHGPGVLTGPLLMERITCFLWN